MLLALATAPAQAAVIHKFEPELSANLSKGVPEGSGALLPGPLSGVNALTADSGHLWVAERSEAPGNPTLVDEFDDSTGTFLRQLNEEAGVGFLELGIAVGHPEGEEQVYVGAAQAGNYVVAVFGPSGTLQHTWTGASTLAKQFSGLVGVAVDGSASLETGGDVYVADRSENAGGGFGRVVVFKPTAGGEEPKETVAELTGTPSGPFEEVQGVAVSAFNGDLLVADGSPPSCREGTSECVVDVFEPVPGMPGKYAFLFAIKEAPQGAFKRIGPMAVDKGSGNIYVVEGQLKAVDEFSREGKYEGRLTGTPSGPFKSPESVAVDPESHRVYVGDHSEETALGAIDAYGGDLVIPDVETLPATEVSPQSAQLNGTVNPRGAGAASCQFVWGESEALGNVATCPPVENGEAAVPRSVTLNGLAPDTKYFYRLQAGNEHGLNTGQEALIECEGKPSVDACFTTLGPGIRGQWSSEVSSTSATLNARVDPHGKPTAVFFEYGLTTAYGSKTPTPPAAIGAGEEVHVEQHIQALTAGTTYHYRTVTVSEFGELSGPDRSFTTQGAGGAFALPDGRHWELVSPPDKRGALLRSIGGEHVIQSSASGGVMTYMGGSTTEEHVRGYYKDVRILSTRGLGGWSSRDIQLPHDTPILPVGEGDDYRFFSEDLSRALVEPHGEFTSLAPEVFPPDSERTPYVRHNSSCEATPATCFRPLVTGAPGYANVPEGTEFGGQRLIVGVVNFVGASPDLEHVALRSKVALIAQAGEDGLYEWSAAAPPREELSLVGILPPTKAEREKGEPGKPAAGAQLGAGHAVSDDGSRIVWSTNEHLYVRDTVKKQTVQLDLPESQCLAKGECGGGVFAPVFQAASHDGSKVFFTDTQRLTRDSRAVNGKPDLYECEVVELAGELQCRISDLTPSAGEAPDVRGTVLGASEDGAWVYFAANGVLGEGAKQGAIRGNCAGSGGDSEGTGLCTLYVWHGGVTLPITVLSGEDHPDWGALRELTARVPPAGGWLAFMSKRSLTGYDNRDALSGQPDEEVYLYHARVSGSGSLEPGTLVCASCDPTGARPIGVELQKEGVTPLVESRFPPGTWIAANIPGWNSYDETTAIYQPRYLSDEGRLFFNSSDALVPQDVNNNEDVYEYEPPGVGGCSSSSATFSERSGGCIALISSGRAAGESAFLDANENGNDVFFLTAERLVPQDLDTALDVYDAHVCSTAVPCLSEPASPPACVTADACRAAPSPQPSVFGAPASATFSGQGNVAPPPTSSPASKRCRKGFVKRHARCVRKRGRHPHKARRSARKGKR